MDLNVKERVEGRVNTCRTGSDHMNEQNLMYIKEEVVDYEEFMDAMDMNEQNLTRIKEEVVDREEFADAIVEDMNEQNLIQIKEEVVDREEFVDTMVEDMNEQDLVQIKEEVVGYEEFVDKMVEDSSSVMKNSIDTKKKLSHDCKDPLLIFPNAEREISDETIIKVENVLQNSVNAVDTIGPNTCEVCRKSFSREVGLVLHKRKAHSLIKYYSCCICMEEFSRKALLTTHMKTHIEDSPYDKVTVNDLKKEISVTSSPNICSVCQNTFPQSEHLNILKEAQVTKNSFICNNCCNMPTESHIFDTEEGHEEFCQLLRKYKTRYYNCEMCGNRFHSKSTFDLHRRVSRINPCKKY